MILVFHNPLTPVEDLLLHLKTVTLGDIQSCHMLLSLL